MSAQTESPVGYFRSSVQWLLEGNTPSYKVEQIVDLLVCVRVLVIQLRASIDEAGSPDSLVIDIADKLDRVIRKSLGNTEELKVVVNVLNELLENAPKHTDNKVFRDVLVQLIIIAENHLDLPFRQLVLGLTEKI